MTDQEHNPAPRQAGNGRSRPPRAGTLAADQAAALQEQAALLDLAHDAIIVHDMDGRIVFWNRGAEELYGWTRAEAAGKTTHMLLRTRFPGSMAELRRRLDTEGRWDGEVMQRTRAGRRIVCRSRWALYRDEYGRPTAVLEIDSDVTERRRAEEQLRRNEELLAEAQRIAHIGHWEYTIRGSVVLWSDEIYRMFGVEPGEFPSTYEGFLERVHPDDRERVKQAVNDALEHGRPYNIDHRIIRQDGTVRHVHEQAEVSYGRDGRPVRMRGTVQDITDRVEAHAEVERQRKRLYSVLDMLPGWVCLVGTDFQYRFTNGRFRRTFGRPNGRPCHEVQFGRTRPCRDCRLGRIVRFGEADQWEHGDRHGRTFDVWGYPFTDTDGTPVVLELGIDVSHRKELERLVMETGEAERRRIGRDLHDTLGQNLTGLSFLIGSFAARVGERAPEEAETARGLVEVMNNAVAQVRALARGLDPVGLHEDGIASGLSELAHYTQKMFDVPCRFECDEELALGEQTVLINHLYHIAREAVTNAVKHAGAERIDIALRRRDDGLVLTVTDDGVGLPASAGRKGEGMGLHIMRYRASVLGADLHFRRAHPRGTRLEVLVPNGILERRSDRE